MTPEAKKLEPAVREAILEVTKELDGHSIYPSEMFKEMALPKKLWKPLLRTHRSDMSDPKATIFDTKTGSPLDELMGVRGLSMLWKLAEYVGADTKIAASKMGRGYQARELQSAIVRALGKNDKEAGL